MSEIWAVGEGKVLRWRGLFLCRCVEVDVDLTEPHSPSPLGGRCVPRKREADEGLVPQLRW